MSDLSLFDQLKRHGIKAPEHLAMEAMDLISPLTAYKQWLDEYISGFGEEGTKFLTYAFLTEQYEKFFQEYPLDKVVELKMFFAVGYLENDDEDGFRRAQEIRKAATTYPSDFVNTLSTAYTKLPPDIEEKTEWALRVRFAQNTASLVESFLHELQGGKKRARLPELPVPGMKPGSLMKFWRTNVLGETQSKMAQRIELWRTVINGENSWADDYKMVTQNMIQQFEIGRIRTPELSDRISSALHWPEHWISLFNDCWIEDEIITATEGHQQQLRIGKHVAAAAGDVFTIPNVTTLEFIKTHKAVKKELGGLLRANLEHASLNIRIEDDNFADLPVDSYAMVAMELPHTVETGMYFVGLQSPEHGEMAVPRIFKADMSSGKLRLSIRDNMQPFDFVSYDTGIEVFRGAGELGKDLNIRLLGNIVGVYKPLYNPGDF